MFIEYRQPIRSAITVAGVVGHSANKTRKRPSGREEPDIVANREELSSDVLCVALHSSHGL